MTHQKKIGVTECLCKVIAMAICTIILHLLLSAHARCMTWHVNFVHSKDAQKQISVNVLNVHFKTSYSHHHFQFPNWENEFSFTMLFYPLCKWVSCQNLKPNYTLSLSIVLFQSSLVLYPLGSKKHLLQGFVEIYITCKCHQKVT